MGKRLLCVTVFLFAAAARAERPALRLSANTAVRIEYRAGANADVQRFAAEEFRRYAGRMLGRDLAWRIAPRTAPDGRYRIQLSTGAKPTVARIAANADVDEFAIETTPDSITIDASNAATLLSAVYALLEMQGCRWLFPGEHGEVVPSRGALDFAPGRKSSRADLPMRGLFPVENLQRYTERDVRDTLDWMAKNRYNHLVFMYNYGWRRLGAALLREARLRDIRLVGYIWSFELFLPLEVGKQHPEYFAYINGQRRVEVNVKRCASSPDSIKLYLRNAVEFLRAHPEIEIWNVIPNDGYHWCECEKCRKLKPKDQWAAFFAPLIEEVRRLKLPVRLQNFIYVNRFDLPENIAPYRDTRLDHFFDVHQRDKWYALREPGGAIGHRMESAVDERARSMTLNNYLADRLRAWRGAVDGRIWIFENLMLHATATMPTPNLPILAADLRAAKAEKLQGYFFESYLQGWNSFACDLWALGRLCWNTSLDERELEREYFRALLGDQADPLLSFYDDFHTKQLLRARACGSLYWMHCLPETSITYSSAVGSIRREALASAGRAWLDAQLDVTGAMREMCARRAASSKRAMFGTERREDVLAIASKLLDTGRGFDGVFVVYEQLRRQFIRDYGSDALGFTPKLPERFDAEVRSLYGRQKLWDTLAEWEDARRFPRDTKDPDLYLRQLLRRAIQTAGSKAE